MGLADSNISSQTISLDSNIFIRALDDSETQGEKARLLLTQIKAASPAVFISTILLEEFFVRVYKERRERYAQDILDFLTMGGLVKIVDMTADIALLAAKIRAKHNLKAPDAIHLASAISAGASVFFSFDRRLPRKVEKLNIRIP